VAARPRHPEDLAERGARLVEDVADRPAVADRCVERAVAETAEVDDGEQDAIFDRLFDACGVLGMERELACRDVAGDDGRSEPRQLEAEATRPAPASSTRSPARTNSRNSRRCTSRLTRSMGEASNRFHSRSPNSSKKRAMCSGS
jgi:hypothetical protein